MSGSSTARYYERRGAARGARPPVIVKLLTHTRRVRACSNTSRCPRPRILRPGSTTASSTAMTPYGRRHFRKRPPSTRSEWRRIRGRSRRSTRPCTFGPRRGIRRRRPAAERPRCIYTSPRLRPHLYGNQPVSPLSTSTPSSRRGYVGNSGSGAYLISTQALTIVRGAAPVVAIIAVRAVLLGAAAAVDRVVGPQGQTLRGARLCETFG